MDNTTCAMTNDIHKSFIKTRQLIDGHLIYPTVSGIYAFFLTGNSDLSDFGKGGQIVYIGIAKDSLHDRDFKEHFKTGKTGSSTFRRSIGAILRTKLKLTAIPRGGENDRLRFNNYKIIEEEILTNWMKLNLEIGYWVPNKILTYEQLRETERQITIALKPALDLDPRTRQSNPLADKLDELRSICRIEAGKK